VKHWIGAGEKRGVGREGQGCRRDAAFEEGTSLGETIDELGLDFGVAVGSEAVCPDRVERDHEHVEIAIGRHY
jgi:hypothetical protein